MLLWVLLALLGALILYRSLGGEPQRTAPLAFTPGMTVSSPVRRGLTAAGEGGDPVSLFLSRRIQRYPGVARDIFRLVSETPVAKPKPKPATTTAATVTLLTPTIPVRSPEEIAADAARADLTRFRFLGYLAEEKDSSLFLSKDGELFIAKSGDQVLKTYRIKAAGKDHVVLYDTATKVEVRLELTGSDGRQR